MEKDVRCVCFCPWQFLTISQEVEIIYVVTVWKWIIRMYLDIFMTFHPLLTSHECLVSPLYICKMATSRIV